jgi:catechol 2,3-dioxygenase-like lactoylglutathione lyase family enzyme
MNLNHINLSVPDLAAARAFFETYLDFVCQDGKQNDVLSVLNGADDFILVLMSQQMNREGNHTYPDSFHIGFYLKDEKEVLDKFEQLSAAGLIMQQEPQKIRRVFGFYYLHQNILIEIVCNLQEAAV